MTTFIVELPSEKLLRRGDDIVRSEAKFWQKIFQRSGSAEGAHADDFALWADVAIPAEGGPHFNGDARGDGGGENAFLVGGVLLVEEFEARHADDAGLDAFGLKFFITGDAVLEFGAGAHEDHFGL